MRIPRVSAFFLLSLIVSIPVEAHPSRADRPQYPDKPSPAADVDGSYASLKFRVVDTNGNPIPSRLTFDGPKGPQAKLFRNADARPDHLAVRKTVVYSKLGVGWITVPPGTYRVYASRGPEWSIDSKELTFKAGEDVSYKARLKREVDTTGWICGDFHLHTLTYSGHGDSNMKERVITFLGEGLEFAVATDHNHHTDYGPTMAELDVHDLTAVVGNEVSVPVGHFNAFPLDPKRPVPPTDARDARALFKLIREEPNKHGIVPVIQVNHPRWGNIDYFGQIAMDPITSETGSERYSDDFDSIEIFNENAGWGYYDAEMPNGIKIGSSKHSVLRDWYNLLNRGHRYAAVGNSDSHTVHSALAAYPRNYVASSTDDPGHINVPEIAQAIRQRRVFTTFGPFVEAWIDGQPFGGDVKAKRGTVELHIKVQAASWIDCDRVKIVVNGDVVEVLPVPDTRSPLRLDVKHTLTLKRDAWVALLVEGDDSMAPIVPDAGRPILPLAVVNPTWIDADADGQWTSPWEQAVHSANSGEIYKTAKQLSPSERGLLLVAGARAQHTDVVSMITLGLKDPERVVRLHAARAVEALSLPVPKKLAFDLAGAYWSGKNDPYFQVAILRALAAISPQQFRPLVFDFLDRQDLRSVRRYADEIFPRMPVHIVRDWEVVGYFPNPTPNTLVTVAHGPEKAPQGEVFEGKGGVKVRWSACTASESGFLNLRKLNDRPGESDNAIAFARTYVWSPDERVVRFAMGTDDGCRVWLNEEKFLTDNVRHRARPYGKLGRMNLRKGWNTVLFKVENGTGAFGLYFRLFDDALRSSRAAE